MVCSYNVFEIVTEGEKSKTQANYPSFSSAAKSSVDIRCHKNGNPVYALIQTCPYKAMFYRSMSYREKYLFYKNPIFNPYVFYNPSKAPAVNAVGTTTVVAPGMGCAKSKGCNAGRIGGGLKSGGKGSVARNA